jgi:hypothetical protein
VVLSDRELVLKQTRLAAEKECGLGEVQVYGTTHDKPGFEPPDAKHPLRGVSTPGTGDSENGRHVACALAGARGPSTIDRGRLAKQLLYVL